MFKIKGILTYHARLTSFANLLSPVWYGFGGLQTSSQLKESQSYLWYLISYKMSTLNISWSSPTIPKNCSSLNHVDRQGEGRFMKSPRKVHKGEGGYWCCPRGPNILGFLGAFFEYKKFFLFFDIFANRTFSTFCAYCGYSSRFQQ